jgi:biopolymer transport protein ExbD
MGSRIGDGAGDHDVIADINITPFVDIILVVLIIFMVTATTIAAINADLPEAATGEGTNESSFGITLMADGRLLLDGAPTTGPALSAKLREAQAQPNAQVECLIAADKTVAWGRVVWLLDLIRTEHIGKYHFQIDKANALPPDPATLGLGQGAP